MRTYRNQKKTIYLIRHAQTAGNKRGNWLGARSVDSLNEYGKLQARETAKVLKERKVEPSKVYSSPTPRALEHAEILQRHLGFTIEKLNSLSEINLGILEDRTREQGMKLVPEEVEDWNKNLKEFQPPLGESALQAAERFYEIIELIAQNDQQADLVFLSHGVVIKLMLARILKASIETGETKIDVPLTTHGSITVLTYQDKTFKFVEIIENAFPDSKRVASFG